MATLFHSLMSASEAVEMVVEMSGSGDAEPRTHALSAHRELADVLVVHADRCCPTAGTVLGYYTAGQAGKMLGSGDAHVIACCCAVTTGAVRLAA